MKNVIRIAGLGLILGTAVSLAALPASARGPMGGFGAGHGPEGKAGFFTVAFADLDKDGNGAITEEDLLAGAEARFGEADTDGDGLVSQDELAATVQARIAEHSQGRHGGWGNKDPEAMSARIAERMLAARDADKDGALSLEELEPGTGFARMIDRFDTDDDNAISEAEFDVARQEMQDRFARRGDHGKGGHGHGHGHDDGHGGGRW